MSLDLGETILQLDRVTRNLGRDYPDRRNQLAQLLRDAAVDADTGIVHSMSTTAANTHDVTEAHNLLHGGETVVWGDAGVPGSR